MRPGIQTARVTTLLVVTAAISAVVQAGCEEPPRRPASQPSVQTHIPQGIPQTPAAFVDMTDLLAFHPRQVTIRLGQTIQWRNISSLRHTVTADPEDATNHADVALPAGADPFNSGTLKPNDTWEYTFRVPGRYKYFCIFHEGQGMVGQIVVEPVAAD